MTFQAPAISELHAVRTSASKLAAWVRGIGVRQVRLTCGLVMFSYIFSHFFNHALGNFSYSTMEWWLTNVHVDGANDPANPFPTPKTLLTIDKDFGGWTAATTKFFDATNGIVTQIQASTGKK